MSGSGCAGSLRIAESAMLDVMLQSWNLRSAVFVSLSSSRAECISLSSPSQEDASPSSSPRITSDSKRLFKLGSLWTCSLWEDMAMVGSIIIACNKVKKDVIKIALKTEIRFRVFLTYLHARQPQSLNHFEGQG